MWASKTKSVQELISVRTDIKRKVNVFSSFNNVVHNDTQNVTELWDTFPLLKKYFGCDLLKQ